MNIINQRAAQALAQVLLDEAQALTCQELDDVLFFLRENGIRPGTLEAILEQHRMYEEPDDRHYLSRRMSDIRQALDGAWAWGHDDCHKIYVCRSLKAACTLSEGGYEVVGVTDVDAALDSIKNLFLEFSCGLRFVQMIDGDPDLNESYSDLVPQGEMI